MILSDWAMILLDATIRSARMTALVVGMLVAADSLGVIFLSREVPPHKPYANAAAWLMAGAVTAFGATLLLASGYTVVGDASAIFGKAVVSGLWLGWAAAFAVRAATRAKRPRMVVVSAALIFVAGIAFAFLDRLMP